MELIHAEIFIIISLLLYCLKQGMFLDFDS